jgi:acyl-CoA synthetase (AMP-forming)/AMP-acid ligase II
MSAAPQSADDRRATWLAPGTVRVYPLSYPATIPAQLHRAVTEFGDVEFVVTAGERITFAAMEERSRRLAAQLVAAGAGKGSRIGMLFPQGPEWIESFLAITRIGAVAMAFSTFLTPAELRKVLRHGDAQLLVVPPTLFGRDMAQFLEKAQPGLGAAASAPGTVLRMTELPYLRSVIVRRADGPSWPAAVDDELVAAMEEHVTAADWLCTIYTSGTTSEPKGVVHTHGTQVRHGANLADLRGFATGDGILAAMPFFWVGGLTCTLLPALHVGCTLVCQERFEAGGALDLIERERPTALMGWPNVRQRLVAHPSFPGRDVEGVPFLPKPGAPEVDLQLMHNSLGMTETSGPHTAAGTDELARILPESLRGSFGPRVPYVEHRIADFETNATLPDSQEGEVCIRGYSVMAGMYKREREEVFDAEGWYHTGDRGYFRDGYLFFTGRATEMIKTAGNNVAPREVEVALEAFPEIRLALVFGRPDQERGQVVVAGVAPALGATVDVDDVRERVRKELSTYKVPRAIVVLADDEIPLLGSGKPDRRAIAATIAAKLDV